MLLMKLPRRGFEDIKDRSLAFLKIRESNNLFVRYSEVVLANFALTQGVFEKEVSDWKSQFERAE